MRKKRTIYFNDARHYYLFVFEPPMQLEDAWRPVDEVAGTAVDTFIYGVARTDGLFYPTKVGRRFGEDMRPLTLAAYWRLWHNMQSLIDRGLDPLTVLIERAHEKGLDFIASLRMSAFIAMLPDYDTASGGRGLAEPEARNHVFAILRELALDYPTDGIELDFAAAPGGMPMFLKEKDAAGTRPILTEYVREISSMVRGRKNGPGVIGARVYPTRDINMAQGLDVETWLREGLLDYVVPMFYLHFVLDADMPIDWVVEEAHRNDISVYGFLQPYSADEFTGSPIRYYATPEMVRAAAANYWERGVDGLYAWFFKWPLGETERTVLTELGDAELISGSSKRYVIGRRSEKPSAMGYDQPLPISIPGADPQKWYEIPFSIADDPAASEKRISRIRLSITVSELVSADRLEIRLNDASLEEERCKRYAASAVNQYQAVVLEFDLEKVKPRRGRNVLALCLRSRPELLECELTIKYVEIHIEYGGYPTTQHSMQTEQGGTV